MDRLTRIRELNDRLRELFLTRHGAVVFTVGFRSLPLMTIARALAEIQRYSGFDEGNDPYNEHDVGVVQADGQKVYWKIDYYADITMQQASPDAADEARCFRVLTIFLPDEY